MADWAVLWLTGLYYILLGCTMTDLAVLWLTGLLRDGLMRDGLLRDGLLRDRLMHRQVHHALGRHLHGCLESQARWMRVIRRLGSRISGSGVPVTS